MKKILIFILFIIANINQLQARLVVKEWHQDNTFVKNGQEISVKLKLKAEEIKDNYYHSEWNYIFDKQSKIKLIKAKILNDNKGKTVFSNNQLTFTFQNTFVDQDVFIEFTYLMENKEIQKNMYVRREYVFIPKFANRAVSSILVKPLKDMELFSLNEKFQKNADGNYYWVGNVPEGGFLDSFEMTIKKAKWKVSTKVEITDENNIEGLSITGPLYFKGGGNSILQYNLSTNQIDKIDNVNLKYDDKSIYGKFNNYNSVNGFFKLEAVLENTYSDFLWAKNLDYNKSIEMDGETFSHLNTIILNVKQEDTSNLPVYVKIAKWVHNNIKYNINLVGAKMNALEILQNKEGVCTHFAILYAEMMRSLNVPAVVVSGLGYNFETQQFEGHAWVMINHNDEWIPIDPTWNIYSGKLPISHIFMYKDIDTGFSFSKEGSLDKFSAKIIHDAKIIININDFSIPDNPNVNGVNPNVNGVNTNVNGVNTNVNEVKVNIQ